MGTGLRVTTDVYSGHTGFHLLQRMLVSDTCWVFAALYGYTVFYLSIHQLRDT